ncbi:hypothetical protein [Bosea rubneri]|jgi:hypothetical protein|uniref:DUF3592 domain-containing protein n=1 Tax=Bosea rubneri TaxID=3075434 RepID=A0ABU3SFC9_9HYPH|nr:hypothetical protein [Bosea sp. ZW T0_25]MDU0343494.1 hypothetical protein [Bosea sp. ZW T0_25]
MAAQRKPSELWLLLFGAAALVLGLAILAASWWKGPQSRERLSLIEHFGRMVVTTPLVRYGGIGHRQSSGTYRTQDIPLLAAGRISGTYRPVQTLWVDDLDRISRGQKLNFLVDPGRRLVYQATTNGRVLLAYEETAAKLRETVRQNMLFGVAFVAIGVFWFAPIVRRHWQHTRAGHQPS